MSAAGRAFVAQTEPQPLMSTLVVALSASARHPSCGHLDPSLVSPTPRTLMACCLFGYADEATAMLGRLPVVSASTPAAQHTARHRLAQALFGDWPVLHHVSHLGYGVIGHALVTRLGIGLESRRAEDLFTPLHAACAGLDAARWHLVCRVATTALLSVDTNASSAARTVFFYGLRLATSLPELSLALSLGAGTAASHDGPPTAPAWAAAEVEAAATPAPPAAAAPPAPPAAPATQPAAYPARLRPATPGKTLGRPPLTVAAPPPCVLEDVSYAPTTAGSSAASDWSHPHGALAHLLRLPDWATQLDAWTRTQLQGVIVWLVDLPDAVLLPAPPLPGHTTLDPSHSHSHGHIPSVSASSSALLGAFYPHAAGWVAQLRSGGGGVLLRAGAGLSGEAARLSAPAGYAQRVGLEWAPLLDAYWSTKTAIVTALGEDVSQFHVVQASDVLRQQSADKSASSSSSAAASSSDATAALASRWMAHVWVTSPATAPRALAAVTSGLSHLQEHHLTGRMHVFGFLPNTHPETSGAALTTAWDRLTPVPVADLHVHDPPQSGSAKLGVTSSPAEDASAAALTSLLSTAASDHRVSTATLGLNLTDPFALAFVMPTYIPHLRLPATPSRSGPVPHNLELLHFLLDGPHPVSTNAKTAAGETALHLAVRSGSLLLTKLVAGACFALWLLSSLSSLFVSCCSHFIVRDVAPHQNIACPLPTPAGLQDGPPCTRPPGWVAQTC